MSLEQKISMSANASTLIKSLKHPLKFRMFLLSSLPNAFFSGLRIKDLDETVCRVTVPYKWFTKNPFRSTYFACLSMAAEMSTGALLYAYLSGSKTKYILVGMKAEFLKKVRGKSFYFCPSGQEVLRKLNSLENPGENCTVILPVYAHDQTGDQVAEFQFYWQFRKTEN